jgi:hypothetical protein
MWSRAQAEEVINTFAQYGIVVLDLDLTSDGDGLTLSGPAT